MSGTEIYSATAVFKRTLNRRAGRSSAAEKEWIDGRTPLAVARKWWWRLTEAERAATYLIVVAEPPDSLMNRYRGPPTAFFPHDGWRKA